MIELYINGQRADVEQKPFTYTLQVNDMFNFDTREVSYSETIYLPTTPTNNIIFRFAIEPISDKSEAYKTHKVDYFVNGIPIVQNAIGYLIGKRGSYYIFEFKDKSLNIYNILAGKKLRDLPLYKLNHTKNESFIRKQKNTDNVIYAIADYGRQYSVNTYDYGSQIHSPPRVTGRPASIVPCWMMALPPRLYCTCDCASACQSNSSRQRMSAGSSRVALLSLRVSVQGVIAGSVWRRCRVRWQNSVRRVSRRRQCGRPKRPPPAAG